MAEKLGLSVKSEGSVTKVRLEEVNESIDTNRSHRRRHHLAIADGKDIPMKHAVGVARPTRISGSLRSTTVPAIQEELESSFTDIALGDSRLSSRASSVNSKIARNSRGQGSLAGQVNAAFVGSTTSSLHEGSIDTAPAMREQYCCLSRWSRLERLLLAIVSFLGVIVVVLIISIGIIFSSPSDSNSLNVDNGAI